MTRFSVRATRRLFHCAGPRSTFKGLVIFCYVTVLSHRVTWSSAGVTRRVTLGYNRHLLLLMNNVYQATLVTSGQRSKTVQPGKKTIAYPTTSATDSMKCVRAKSRSEF